MIGRADSSLLAKQGAVVVEDGAGFVIFENSSLIQQVVLVSDRYYRVIFVVGLCGVRRRHILCAVVRLVLNSRTFNSRISGHHHLLSCGSLLRICKRAFRGRLRTCIGWRHASALTWPRRIVLGRLYALHAARKFGLGLG